MDDFLGMGAQVAIGTKPMRCLTFIMIGLLGRLLDGRGETRHGAKERVVIVVAWMGHAKRAIKNQSIKEKTRQLYELLL